MKKYLLTLFLMVGLFGLVACDATEEPATEEPATEEVENSVEVENEVEAPEDEVSE